MRIIKKNTFMESKVDAITNPQNKPMFSFRK